MIEGVNTSAANVFVYDKKINRTDLDFFSFANIRGRVGRMMRHFVGNAFLYHEPPQQIDTNVDVPVLSGPSEATDYLLMNVESAELSPTGRNRQQQLPIDTGLSPDTLRAHGAMGVQLLSTLNERVRQMLRDNPTRLIWKGFPQRDERVAVAELVLLVAHSRGERTGVHTPKQIAWAWSMLSQIKKLSDFLSWFVDKFSASDVPDGIDRAFQFLQACEFGFPRTLAAVEALVKEAAPTSDPSYLAFVSMMECWFRPVWMKELDEVGIPLPLAERLAPLIGDVASRFDALQAIRRLSLDKTRFDRIDQFILNLALSAG